MDHISISYPIDPSHQNNPIFFFSLSLPLFLKHKIHYIYHIFLVEPMGQVLAYYLFLYKLAKNDLNIFKWLKIVICNN